MNSLGALLRSYRWEHHISMRALANDIGLSCATLCRIEQGRSVSLRVWMVMQSWLLAPASVKRQRQLKGK